MQSLKRISGSSSQVGEMLLARNVSAVLLRTLRMQAPASVSFFSDDSVSTMFSHLEDVLQLVVNPGTPVSITALRIESDTLRQDIVSERVKRVVRRSIRQRPIRIEEFRCEVPNLGPTSSLALTPSRRTS